MRKFELNIQANNKEWLIEHYITNKESMEQIAKICDTTVDTIRTRLNRFKIQKRNHKQSLQITNKKQPRKRKVFYRHGYYKVCKFCGTSFYVNQRSKRVYCSKSCGRNYWKEHRKRDQDWRYYPEYKEWRNLVYFRDNWKCKICGSKLKINAHHIFIGKDYPSRRFDTSNGITLCEVHHIQIHSPNSEELLLNNPNFGGSLEVDNPEASLREYLISLIRSND